MAVNTQFAIAVHLLAGLAYRGEETTTSRDLARTVNASPSFLRRTLAKLSKAGLIETCTGKAGACWLAKEPKRISLLDIYEAVDAPQAIAIHDYDANKACPVSCNVKTALVHALQKTQGAMDAALAKITLADIVADIQK
jgi:Rrf2 family protein